MAVYVLGLGSSMGDRMAWLSMAQSALVSHPLATLRGVSRIYETPPLGGQAVGAFANAAIAIEWAGSPLELLSHAKECELRLGRKKSARWADRVIDIDLLWCSKGEISTTGLQIPHPRLNGRNFAIWPLVEAWPTALDLSGVTYRKRLRQLMPPAAIGVLAG